MPMPYLNLSQVELIAREAHREQTDKAGRPYAEHLAAVAEGVRIRGGNEEQIAAAWLHDAIEDGALSRRWLDEAPLSGRVKDMVLAVTKRDGEDLFAYTGRILATPGALLIKESDLAHNADPDRLAVLEAGDPYPSDREICAGTRLAGARRGCRADRTAGSSQPRRGLTPRGVGPRRQGGRSGQAQRLAGLRRNAHFMSGSVAKRRARRIGGVQSRVTATAATTETRTIPTGPESHS